MPTQGLKAGTAGPSSSKRHSMLGPELNHEGSSPSIVPDPSKSSLLSGSISPSPLNQEMDATSRPTSSNEENGIGNQLRPTRSAKQTPKSHRFSLMKFRHASDPNLSTSYSDAEAPPVPSIPSELGKTLIEAMS